MAIKINREMAGNLNSPTSELLNYCISQHLSTIGRLDKLSDYYDGEQDILKRTKDNDAIPNNKVVINHAKYVTDMNVGFRVIENVGNGPPKLLVLGPSLYLLFGVLVFFSL